MNRVEFKHALSGEANCRLCAIRDSVLFAGLEEKDFEKIHKPIDQLVLQPGKKLYRAGDKAEKMFTIRSGLIKLVQYLPDGSQRIVRLMRTSDVIGLEGLLDQVYEHDAVVMQAAEVCCLPVAVVRTLSAENPRLQTELLNRWQRALHEADAWITELSTGSARQRVARLLLRLARGQENSECQLFGREDMGAMLGITTETASRIIAEFKRQSLLMESRSNHFLLDVPNLNQIAGED